MQLPISSRNWRTGSRVAVAVAVCATLVASMISKSESAGAAASGPPAVLIPTSGAYFGSWVAPRGTEPRTQAIERVEGQIGRRFAIDHQYYRWDSVFPGPYETWTRSQGRIPFLNWKAMRSVRRARAVGPDRLGGPGRDDHRARPGRQGLRVPDVPDVPSRARGRPGGLGHRRGLRRGVPPRRERVPGPGRRERRVGVDDDVVDLRPALGALAGVLLPG